MNDVTHWFEKYRPRQIAECVLLPDVKDQFRSFVAKGHCPHLLLEYDLLVRAVEFYQTHFGYRYKILAGAGKINLGGKEVSIVTEHEYLNMQKKIREDKAKLRKRNEANPITTARALYQSGQIPDDQLKKIDALPMMKAPVKVTPKVIEAAAPVVPKPAKPTLADTLQRARKAQACKTERQNHRSASSGKSGPKD